MTKKVRNVQKDLYPNRDQKNERTTSIFFLSDRTPGWVKIHTLSNVPRRGMKFEISSIGGAEKTARDGYALKEIVGTDGQPGGIVSDLKNFLSNLVLKIDLT